MTARPFDADHAIHDPDFDGKSAFNERAQLDRIVGADGNHIPAHLVFQGQRFVECDELPPIEQCEPVAAFGFFHDMGRNQYGHTFLSTQFGQVIAHFPAHARVEASAGLIEQEQRGFVEQAAGNFDAAP